MPRLGAVVAAAAVLVVLGVAASLGLPRPKPAAPPAIIIPAERTEGGRIWYPAARAPAISLPNGETRRVLSLLDVQKTMTFGDFVWRDEGVPEGPLWVRVDLTTQLISVFRGEHEIGSAVILYGAQGKPSPSGVFPVLQKARDYHSRTYDAPMPFMLRLTADGVAIHASNVREGWATHGCIGVPAEFARKLFDQARLGDVVAIVRSAPRA